MGSRIPESSRSDVAQCIDPLAQCQGDCDGQPVAASKMMQAVFGREGRPAVKEREKNGNDE